MAEGEYRSTYKKEADFEADVITELGRHGWAGGVLRFKSEAELLDNWADILFKNNNTVDRLNGVPLSAGEKAQLLERVRSMKSPVECNRFINGKTTSIKRDNPLDPLHLGKEVSLFIYDRVQIAEGLSVYQIAEQPLFPAHNALETSSRGDLMLLINGMPVIHIELKRSGIPVSQATEQIKRYAAKGVFTGLFSLVQVFVAMTSEDCLYFANPGDAQRFNNRFFFRWADFRNQRYTSWVHVVSNLLSIPMGHKLVGFYTVCDDADGALKVLRSYQYYAVEGIRQRVERAQWTKDDHLGGYVWHTTGSGKTLTAFKAAELLSFSNLCEKVVFLMDRIELGTQSAAEYRNFAGGSSEVQETEDTNVLCAKLKSNNPQDALIVTSIQKMARLSDDDTSARRQKDIEEIAQKRIVFIIDECHRSTFGSSAAGGGAGQDDSAEGGTGHNGGARNKETVGMYTDIKNTFPCAIYFGFTGTPILNENKKNGNTQTDLFGERLHCYTIKDGIKDGNVLGFDPRMEITFEDNKLRREVALREACAKTVKEAMADDKKKKIYLSLMNSKTVPMAGEDRGGVYVKGIENYVPIEQYERDDKKPIEGQYQYKVADKILEDWVTTSVDGKYHAIFAASSIKEACEYYRLFKSMMGNDRRETLKVACLFDPSILNDGSGTWRESALAEMLGDYNAMYKQCYSIPTYQSYKKDVADRMAHKGKYVGLGKEEVLDLLIVVDQMLTGYDSKWVNTLYLDKVMEYEAIVQAFSRTNRICGDDKPYGIVKYFRYPHTMARKIKKAFELYSKDKDSNVFVNKLPANIKSINETFDRIRSIFENAGVTDFAALPDGTSERREFAKLFSQMEHTLIAAKLQGFLWTRNDTDVEMHLDEKTFLILAKRYKELFSGEGESKEGIPFDIDPTCMEIAADKIDADYLEGLVKKYASFVKAGTGDTPLALSVLQEIHKSFAALSQKQQKAADEVIYDVQSGALELDDDKTFSDYIACYMARKEDDIIRRAASLLGYDEKMLRSLTRARPTDNNLNDYGRFDELLKTLKVAQAASYFEKQSGKNVPPPMARMQAEKLIKRFVLAGGFEI